MCVSELPTPRKKSERQRFNFKTKEKHQVAMGYA